MQRPLVLGINASHNGACCLLEGDQIIAAIQEERLTRRKRHRIGAADPAHCIQYCLEAAGVTPADLSMVVVCVQKGVADMRNDVHLNPMLRVDYHSLPVHVISHHYGHAISTFATSGFSDAAILIADGVGSYWEDLGECERCAPALGTVHGQETVSLYDADMGGVRALEKHFAPPDEWLSRNAWLNKSCPTMPSFHSLGGMYSAVATQIFGDMDEAGKVMGLAPYGNVVYPTESFYAIHDDGSFVFSDAVPRKFRGADRWPLREKEYQDLAASAQAALEAALLHLVGRLRESSTRSRLCLAGGVALNSVANERIIAESGFSDVHIMPASDDGGTAIGAAYYGLWQLERLLRPHRLSCDGIGRRYTQDEIAEAQGAAPAIIAQPCTDVIEKCAEFLAKGAIVAWFYGGAEFGPRALGHRSILCDPRRHDAKDQLNSRVKHRECFRPFAPAVLLDYVEEWFDLTGTPAESPFMLRVARWREDSRSLIPAVVHVDGTGRLQTVTPADGAFCDVIRAFHEITGVPILLNTSFNIMSEPIIETPADALWALAFTGIDYCIIEGQIFRKRPGFESIAELYASLSSNVLGMTVAPNGSGGLPKRDEAVGSVRVRKQWGISDVPVSLAEVTVMKALLPDVPIRDMSPRLAQAVPELGLSERDVIFIVAALRRFGVVEVSDRSAVGLSTCLPFSLFDYVNR